MVIPVNKPNKSLHALNRIWLPSDETAVDMTQLMHYNNNVVSWEKRDIMGRKELDTQKGCIS
jgi:hypothetical protein